MAALAAAHDPTTVLVTTPAPLLELLTEPRFMTRDERANIDEFWARQRLALRRIREQHPRSTTTDRNGRGKAGGDSKRAQGGKGNQAAEDEVDEEEEDAIDREANGGSAQTPKARRNHGAGAGMMLDSEIEARRRQMRQ